MLVNLLTPNSLSNGEIPSTSFILKINTYKDHVTTGSPERIKKALIGGITLHLSQ